MSKLSKRFTKICVGIGVASELSVTTYALLYESHQIFAIIGLSFPVIGYFADDLRNIIRYFRALMETKKIEETIDMINSPKLQTNVQEYTDKTRKELREIVSNIKDGIIELDPWQLDKFIEITFKTPIHYKAIDVSLPSKYMEDHKSYLDAQKKSLISGERRKEYRVILQESTEINRDSRTKEFSRFWQWHTDNKVNLLHMSPTCADKIIKEHGINPDDCKWGIGLWDNEFAILFGYPESQTKTKLRILDNTHAEFQQIAKLCEKIRSEAEIIQSNGAPRILKDAFIEKWRDYILPDKRWNIIQPFLYHFLDQYRKKGEIIIDIAAGIGIEYFFMMDDGFLMHANEIQDELREQGEKYRQDRGYTTKYTASNYGWSELTENGMGGMYGGVFATGNSIRMLQSSESQQEAVDQFFAILKKGGTIIIDERNHDRLLPYAEKINNLANNKNDAELFRDIYNISHLANPLYHGNNISAVPYYVDKTKAMFCYYPGHDAINNLNEAESKKIQDWQFFHDDVLEDILKKAGFTDIQKYADYDMGRRLEEKDTVDDVSMFVYVARKP